MIVQIAGRGRCVVANKSYKTGDLIFVEEPYAMVVTEEYAPIICSYCNITCVNGTMYALSSESNVRYCSEKCITADYPIHFLETTAIIELEKLGVDGSGLDSMRLVFRIAATRKHEQTALSSKIVKNVPVYPLNGR